MFDIARSNKINTRAMEDKPIVTDYWDYRKYLSDFYVHNKCMRMSYSYKAFCNEAGLKSPSLFKMVLDGSRNLTSESVPKFIKGLKLVESGEKDFFYTLVNYNQETDLERKTKLFQDLLQLKSKDNVCPMEFYQFEFLSKWHLVAIYVMIDLSDFQSDIDWIQTKLKKRVSRENILSALETLTKLNLIRKNSNGEFEQANTSISTPDEILSHTLKNYHHGMMNLALTSLETDLISEREFTGATLPLCQEQLDLVKGKIRDFRKELSCICENMQNKNQVYQLNLQLFPLTNGMNDENFDSTQAGGER